MTTEERIIRGDRFAITGRPGVYNVDADEDFGCHSLMRFHQEDSPGSYQGFADFTKKTMIFNYTLLGRFGKLMIPLASIDFEKL
ncbi:hypothetical protein GCM10007423_39640 [Dyadobacter endophyticus]|uniref:Uncharacterized protein n=1 Tax=Dyadobacter endophyticus TaxID=1749036 RepID=A0ABQ1YXY0_9BACT|nr:hypothetical protein [Dyadobacter endophyticus]GGH42772.1 hypothetical protein GCM10007423_39640 [Dyadobacter endophyticus]